MAWAEIVRVGDASYSEAMEVRCPHRRSTTTIGETDSTVQIQFSRCGSRFHFLAEETDDEGVTLADWLTGKQLTIKEAVQLAKTLASALQHAHENGVLHRDLSPATG